MGVLAEEAAHGLVGVLEGGGIAGAVAEEDAVRVHGEDIGGGGGGGDDGDAEALLAQMAKDVVLEAEIVRDDAMGDGRELAEDFAARVDLDAGSAVAFDDGPDAGLLVLRVPLVGAGRR